MRQLPVIRLEVPAGDGDQAEPEIGLGAVLQQQSYRYTDEERTFIVNEFKRYGHLPGWLPALRQSFSAAFPTRTKSPTKTCVRKLVRKNNRVLMTFFASLFPQLADKVNILLKGQKKNGHQCLQCRRFIGTNLMMRCDALHTVFSGR